MPYKEIGDYGVVGDRRTAALVGRDGSIDWLCLPDFDGASVFGALLDDGKGGRFRLAPRGGALGRQAYVENTNVLRTSWETIELTDCMADPGSRPAAEESRRALVRRLQARGGAAACELECAPAYDYGRTPVSVERVDGGALLRGNGPTLALAVPGADDALEVSDHRVHARLELDPGEVRWVVLATAEDAGGPATWTARRAEEAFAGAERYWREWATKVTYRGPYRHEMIRCALLVHLLTYAPEGSVVAAPTTSLPEVVGGPKNFDYRYTWVRDASLSIAVLSMLGPIDEAKAYMDWLVRLPADARHDAPLQVMYGIRGETELPERTLDHLEGYRGSKPVRVGNDAHTQFQIGSFGILADCVERYVSHGGEWRQEYWELVRRVADFVAEHWRREGNSIWELSEPQPWVGDKMLAWVTLERAVRIAGRVGSGAPVDRWRRVMEEIHRDVMSHGWSQRERSFVQRYGAENVDAAVLLGLVLGFLPGDHPRVLDTLERLHERLGDRGMLRRFDPNETPGTERIEEATFNPCTLWRIASLARAGYGHQVDRLLERFLETIQPLQLVPEEADAETGAMVGNFPLLFAQIELARAGMLASRSDVKHRIMTMAAKGAQLAKERIDGVRHGSFRF